MCQGIFYKNYTYVFFCFLPALFSDQLGSRWFLPDSQKCMFYSDSLLLEKTLLILFRWSVFLIWTVCMGRLFFRISFSVKLKIFF